MLGILKKIAAGQKEFSAKELPFMVQWFDRFAKNQQRYMLEQLWPYIPADQRENILSYSLNSLQRNSDPAIPDDGAFKFLLSKAEEIASPGFWKRIFPDQELSDAFHYAVESGVEENIDLILDAATRHKGVDFTRRMLPSSGMGFRHIHTIDKLLHLGNEWGGEDLAKDIIGYSDYGFAQIIDTDFGPSEDIQPRVAVAVHLLQKQYEIGGAEAVIKSFHEMFDALLPNTLDERTDLILPVIESLWDIGGSDLFKAVMSSHDFWPARCVAQHGFDLMFDFKELAEQTQDRDFITALNEKSDLSFSAGLNAHQYLHLTLESIKGGETPQDETVDALRGAYEAWLRKNGIGGGRRMQMGKLRSRVIKEIVARGRADDLRILSELHDILGKPDTYPEALKYFSHAAQAKSNSKLMEDLLAFALKAHGEDYVRTLLTRPIRRFQPLAFAADHNDLDTVRVYLDMAEKIGGHGFVSQLIWGHKKNFDNLKYRGPEDAERLQYLVQRLVPEAQNVGQEVMHLAWRAVAERKIPKSTFYQRCSDRKFRWYGITGAEAPDASLETQSPYRFKLKLYEAILPLMKVAAEIEGSHYPETDAFKLAVLFSNEREVEEYLKKCVGHWHIDIREACDFELPDYGEWEIGAWKSLIMNHGPKIFPYIEHAGVIEVFYDIEPSMTVHNLHAMCMNIGLKLTYKNQIRNPELAKVGYKYNLPPETFDRLTEFIWRKGKKTDYIPAVIVDGASIGHPNFYMSRLAPNDPMGFVLGAETGDCQTVNGNGEDCALYGMSSPYGGFYVWKKKTEGKITESDDIAAQSWVWVGHDNMIVFDSFEPSEETHKILAQSFLEQFAFEVEGKHSFIDNSDHTIRIIAGVRLGCDKTGRTPKLNLSKTTNPSEPINYKGEYDDRTPARDSFEQFIIEPINHASCRALPAPADLTKEATLSYVNAATELSKPASDDMAIEVEKSQPLMQRPAATAAFTI